MRITRFVALLAGTIACPASAFDFTWTGTFDARDDEWSVPGHWDGLFGFYPSTRSDSALIDGTTLFDPAIDLDVSIGAVTIRGGGTLDTNGFVYSINDSGGLSGDTIIEDAGSLLLIRAAGVTSDAGSGIIINDGGTVRLEPGDTPRLNARTLDIATGGVIEGAGTLAQLGRTGVVSNDGILRAKSGTLVLQPWDAGDVFDWDGSSEDGRIEIAVNSELRIEMDVEPFFDGTIDLNYGAVLDVQDSWTLSDNGILRETASGIVNPSRVRGGIIGVRGQIQVRYRPLVLEAEIFVLPTGKVLVTQNKSVHFDAPATFEKADGLEYVPNMDSDPFYVTGLFINSDVSIGSGLGSGRFNMDGFENVPSDIEIATGAALIIDADGIDEFDDTFNATLGIKGLLDVTVADGEWEMAGRIDISSAGGALGDPPVIRGSLMRVTGNIDVELLNLDIESSVIFDQGCDVDLGGIGEDIRTYGPLTRLNGCEILGGWRVDFLSPSVEVTASTVIESSDRLRLGDDTTWNIQAACVVESRQVVGGDGFLDTGIHGTTIITAPGYLELVPPDQIGMATTVFEGPLELNGTGGLALLRGTNTIRLEGDTTVDGDVGIQAPVEFAGLMSLGLNSDLRLLGGTAEQPIVVEPTAQFSPVVQIVKGYIEISGETRVQTGASLGDSEVNTEIAPGGVLTLEPFTDGGRFLENRGTIKMGDPGEPIGGAHCDFFNQYETGRLIIRVGPAGADVLFGFTTLPPPFSPSAALRGELVVTLEDGFTPSHGDTHTVVSFGNTNGEFDTVTGPDNMEVLYDPDGVRIRFTDPGCNAADLVEPFGVLDLGDINAFISGFNNQEPISDLDGNGVFDLADIGMFIAAFSAGCP